MLGAQVGLPLPTAVASHLPPAWAPAGRTSPSAGQACLCPISGDTCLLRGDREDPSESFLPSFAVGQVRGGGDTHLWELALALTARWVVERVRRRIRQAEYEAVIRPRE